MNDQANTAPGAPSGEAPASSRAGLWVGLAVTAFCIAVITYIAVTRPTGTSLADAENKAQVDLGRVTYQQHCMDCHGERLKGKPTWHRTIKSQNQAGTPLNADGVTWHLSDQRLFSAIATGVRVKGEKTKQIHDVPFAGTVSDDEIWALIAYFKTTWTARQLHSQQETTLREMGQAR